MKAYSCDSCETYYQGSPAGVLYDNSDHRHGVRYDLCPECLEKALSGVEFGAIEVIDLDKENEE